MTRDLDFYFDFLSPYTFLASRALPGLARVHGLNLRHRPMNLVALMQQVGNRPTTLECANKGAYVIHWETCAAGCLFNAVRFALAGALYWVVTVRRQRGFTRDEIVGGWHVGWTYAAGMVCQVTGLRWVVPSVAGFFTALPVVFAPLAQALIFKRPVERMTWIAVGLAAAGIVLLSWPKPEAVAGNTIAVAPPVAYLGEMLTVAAAMVFTAEIMFVDRYGRHADPVRLTFVMLLTTSVLSLVAGLLIGGAGILRGASLAGLFRDTELAWSLGTLVVISSVMAMHLMIRFQPLVSPAVASVIYCTEPIFSTLFSLLFATERLTALTVVGGAVVVASVLVVAGRKEKIED